MVESMISVVAPAFMVTRREVRDQLRDWRVIFPIIVLTVFFPWLMNFTAKQAVAFVARYGAPIVGDRLIPFLLMVVGFFPISVSLVIALESFVGEKERGSIEPLLISPLKDWQIYIGKLLASTIPPLLASYLGIAVYLVGVYIQVGWRPEPILLIQILLLTMVQALVMVSGAVVVSAQATSVRAANLLASFIIIPMALLIQGESIVMFWGRYSALWWVILAQVIIAILLVRTGVSHFYREELLGRELDTLNLGNSWLHFKDAFRGEAQTVWDWYRREIPGALRRLNTPIVLVVLLLLVSLFIGAEQAQVFVLPIDVLDLKDIDRGSIEGFDSFAFFTVSGIGTVWWHNLRVIILATFMGIFSFGVLGIVILMLPIILIGYFMASLANMGLSPQLFLTALVLPHGILEVPAIILAGASILRLGGTMVAPAKDQTVGEAWLASLADWLKVMLGLVLPLLLGAAALEIWLTPRIAVLLLGN